jgi:Tfp pilus assembly protein PilN
MFFSSSKAQHVTLDKTKINLAPRDPFYESTLGKLIQWALTIGRYLVIFTELVVILSFLSRFQLDRTVTDLNTAIVQKQRVIESYGDLEQNVRDVQKKIDTYSQLKEKEPFTQSLTKLSAITPTDIRYQDLTIQKGAITIVGHAGSRQAIEQFIVNLQADPYFSNVVSENISNRDSQTTGYDFQISAMVTSQVPKAVPARRPTQPPPEGAEAAP